MKKILGLDLGTTSIGWALVNEAEHSKEKSAIIQLGVRVVPLTTDEQSNFEKGKSITTNADRSLKKSMRRNLQRYKLRRANLIECLKENRIITDETIFCEQGNFTTFQTYRNRAKAATAEISLEEFARVLLMLNKKRGYKSNRKATSDEGTLIDGMSIAQELYEKNITPGEYVYALLKSGKKYVPDFYRSDLQTEFNRIWDAQKPYYSDILTEEFKTQIQGRSKTNTTKIFLAKYGIYTADNKGKDKRLQAYEWRMKALQSQLTREELAFVIAEVNGAIYNSSGYLGAISDRSKELYFNHQTIGQYLMTQLQTNPHFSLKNKTFYRQDYLDEFEKIWECQAKYHPELTPDLKKEIRDIIIFYQRPLKSKKGLLDICEFENRTVEVEIEGKKKTKKVGLKVCPKASPLFQEFKIWQILNNLEVIDTLTYKHRRLEQEEKELLFEELTVKEKLSKTDILKTLYGKTKNLDLNYKEVEGNCTMAAIWQACLKIVAMTGHDEYDATKLKATEIKRIVRSVFDALGYKTDALLFHSELEGKSFYQQSSYKLWHLLYSYEGDNSKTGTEKLIEKITALTGLEKEYASILSNITFKDDYGNLSAKAIRKILPFMKEGNEYSLACEYAGYRHSKNSLTKEEIENTALVDHLDLLPRNSLRNPVVEKILNQMINVVNELSSTYGKPDEIRIELARELKKSAKEREQLTNAINKATAEHEKYKEVLEKEFGIKHVSRNDILRYRLYLELKENGFKTLYTDTYIPQEKLFSKEFDIEHIIPQARLFDDSFSNKTLEKRDANIEKSNSTAFDYVLSKYEKQGAEKYKTKIDDLYKGGVISKAKHDKLLMTESDIPEGFIDRDLRNSQYIAKKAREILEQMVKFVVPTTGSITDRLREDWQLVDVMQELNWDKYDRLGLTETYHDKEGREIHKIIDWTKRNDHRHHAMDALTIAFTTRAIIQYLNNLNARSDKSSSIYGIEKSCLYRDKHGKLRFNPPMPLDELRQAAKSALGNILVSIKAKNKVMTQNVNKSKTKGGYNKKIQLTPRGQLHNESIYGNTKRYVTKEVKVGANMTKELIEKVTKKKYRDALFARLAAFGGDSKKAFTGRNSLDKNPIYLDEHQIERVPNKVRIVEIEAIYPIRKAIDKDLKVEKVIDAGIRKILEKRLEEYGGDTTKAFSNLDENPIWLNQEAGISIKRVRITGISNATPLREKKDHKGNFILDEAGKRQPVDFVNTGNNHHVAIFRDENGELQEHLVSFYEATARVSLGLPVVDKEYKQSEGWTFLFTMKQNEYFIFPNKATGFDPKEIDLMNPDNYEEISKNLYRVQKLSTKNYCFRHHLETMINDNNNLKGLTWLSIRSLSGLVGMLKVRINHIGQI
ncbi:MAG: type II CRISPR RNA-guided endonuclease Cas9, partial [Bacteroidaceae bacterium]|nr:type II CRISPR RNA-guided endonuclease Cas9 [Bacteroidaceae bacterium]